MSEVYDATVDLIATKWGDEKLNSALTAIQAEKAAQKAELAKFRDYLKSAGGSLWKYSCGGYCNVDNEYDLATLYERVKASQRCAATCPKCSGLPCRFKLGEKGIETKVRLDKVVIYYSSYFCEKVMHARLLDNCALIGVPARYIDKSFKDYEVTADNERAIKMVQWYVAEKPSDWLYFGGGYGTGKTFLASLMAKELLKNFELHWPQEILQTIRFVDMSELFSALKTKMDIKNESPEKYLKEYCKVEILILDDFGAEKITDWSLNVLYHLVNERYKAERRTILTSNYDLEGLEKRLSVADAGQAGRIVSRLMEMSQVATFGRCDRRRRSFDA